MATNTKSEETGYRLSYKFRLYPTPEQEHYFAVNFGCVRYVYNHFLEARIKAYEAYKADPEHCKPLSFYDTSKALTTLKKETVDEEGHKWLYDADATALVYALRHLDSAYQNFFRRVKKGEKPGFPKFKSRYSAQSFTVASCKIPDRRHVVLPKIGPVPARIHREIKGEIVNATISKNAAGQYYVSVNVKDVQMEPLPAKENAIGIATGIQKWVVTSDGEVFDNPRNTKKYEKKLAREQRRLSRKVPGSSNYQKQKLKVARIQNRIAKARSYSMHNLTRELVNGNGIIVSRDMAVSRMLQNKDGEKLPVAAKKKINRALLDAGFAEINRQLAYKAEWGGRVFVLVNHDYPTTQVCSKCGYKHTVLAEDIQANWICPECQTVHDRKFNAAINILQAGVDILNEQEASYVSIEASKTRKKREAKQEKKNNRS